MKEGQAICLPFIDGLLYPKALGVGITPKELLANVKRTYGRCSLQLFKLDERKTEAYFTNGSKVSGYFGKLDDTAYDFTVRRIEDLQKASEELQHALLKLDVT